MTVRAASAVACANIALAKYWGKADELENLPAVPSLSLTLAGLATRTRVEVDTALDADEIVLDGAPAAGRPRERVVRMLDELRGLAGARRFARVASTNDFPTASGLASSASGFAALALSGAAAFGLGLERGAVSALARRASASAARSLFGGYVALEAGARSAERVLSGDDFPLFMVVALTSSGPKSVGSTEGMLRTAATSPYYRGWLDDAPRVYRAVRDAVLARDLAALGPAVEASALRMHASMFAADPPIVYFTAATLAVMQAVRELRSRGTLAFHTMDAGPHVKVLTAPENAELVAGALRAVPGVERVVVCSPGPDATLEVE
ncbi:MAG TPA: diphosphomevalonate decarboxylase [Polyangiaceae bacterium]